MTDQIRTQKNYQILSRLGQGLSSDLYKCIRRDPKSNFQQIVTLKIYKSDVFRKKFHNELENLSRINCEGIPKVLDWSYDEDQLTIVTEYVDGCDLDLFIRLVQSGKLSISTDAKVYIIKSIFKSLRSLHESGICHGDLKPSNVLLSTEGKIKLIDICLGDHGHIYATPEFSAPEVLAGHRPDYKSDLYSLGLIAQSLDLTEFQDLLQIKPGMRRFKKTERLQADILASELSVLIWKAKYSLDSGAVIPGKLEFSRRPVEQVGSTTVEYHPVLTQEMGASAPSVTRWNGLKPLVVWKYVSNRLIQFSACLALVVMTISSQAQVTHPNLATMQLRSLKSYEVWDKGRWNSLPYDYYLSTDKAKVIALKLRNNKEIKKMNVYVKPYEQKRVQIDAL